MSDAITTKRTLFLFGIHSGTMVAEIAAPGVAHATAAQSGGNRLRAVVYGGGIGIFPPLMQRFQQDFDVIATLQPDMPGICRLWFAARSIAWPRTKWYRRWRHLVEKTPFAFRCRTRESERCLRRLRDRYDVILFGGATFAPRTRIDTPLFVFADFCRRLSSRNPHDEVSHFRSADEESAWLELEGRVYRSAARVFVGSEFVRRALIGHYDVDPARVVASGFGAGLGFGDPYEKRFDGRSILFIGKGDFEKKGGAVLLQAFERVRRAMPETVLHIVGQDRLPRVPGVVSHGLVHDRQRMVSMMRSAHVFTLPSLVDRNPISVLEAMAAATPCVTSDYAAIPEILGDAGLAVPCGDVGALSQALLSILRDSALAARLGAAGRERFERRYNWDQVWQVIRAEMKAALDAEPVRRSPAPPCASS